MQKAFSAFVFLLVCPALFAQSTVTTTSSETSEWPNYGNDPGRMRYSPLVQINKQSVTNLQVAWTFHTGDISDGKGERRRSGFESTPILIDGSKSRPRSLRRHGECSRQVPKTSWSPGRMPTQKYPSADGVPGNNKLTVAVGTTIADRAE